jgi:hypothetical protein
VEFTFVHVVNASLVEGYSSPHSLSLSRSKKHTQTTRSTHSLTAWGQTTRNAVGLAKR